jgi:hypothetical protein
LAARRCAFERLVGNSVKEDLLGLIDGDVAHGIASWRKIDRVMTLHSERDHTRSAISWLREQATADFKAQ